MGFEKKILCVGAGSIWWYNYDDNFTGS